MQCAQHANLRNARQPLHHCNAQSRDTGPKYGVNRGREMTFEQLRDTMADSTLSPLQESDAALHKVLAPTEIRCIYSLFNTVVDSEVAKRCLAMASAGRTIRLKLRSQRKPVHASDSDDRLGCVRLFVIGERQSTHACCYVAATTESTAATTH
jgi:hypothetical protein